MQPQYRDVLIKTRSHSVENVAVLIKFSNINSGQVLEYVYSYLPAIIFSTFKVPTFSNSFDLTHPVQRLHIPHFVRMNIADFCTIFYHIIKIRLFRFI